MQGRDDDRLPPQPAQSPQLVSSLGSCTLKLHPFAVPEALLLKLIQTHIHIHHSLTLPIRIMASSAENENTAVVVDETPISPVRSNERRNSLEKHLQHRPEAQDLKNRHILLDTTTAPYVTPVLQHLTTYLT